MNALKRNLISKFTKIQMKVDYNEELIFINVLKKWLDVRLHDTHINRYVLRAICQYQAQAFLRKKTDIYLANLIAVFYIPVLLLKVRWLTKVPPNNRLFTEYLKVNRHMAYQIPPQIQSITIERQSNESYLLPADVKFAFNHFIKSKCLYPELFVKFLIWVSTVRPHLDNVQCRNLIQYCEYSATSSLRKAYLNAHGICLVNVTHGEEIISCRSAFSSFDKCFAWHITPRYIYDAMQIECEEFHTFNPCFEMPKAINLEGNPRIGVLWPAIENQQPECIAKQLLIVQKYFEITVRPHPNELYRAKYDECMLTLKVDVSNPHEEELSSFLERCSVIIGYSSAVLLQAAWRGRAVLYINNSQLDSVRKYHEYYRSVSVVEVDKIADYLLKTYLKDYPAIN